MHGVIENVEIIKTFVTSLGDERYFCYNCFGMAYRNKFRYSSIFKQYRDYVAMAELGLCER